MRKPFITLSRRSVTDQHGTPRFTAIGIEFGLKDEDYTYTFEKDHETDTIMEKKENSE